MLMDVEDVDDEHLTGLYTKFSLLGLRKKYILLCTK